MSAVVLEFRARRAKKAEKTPKALNTPVRPVAEPVRPEARSEARAADITPILRQLQAAGGEPLPPRLTERAMRAIATLTMRRAHCPPLPTGSGPQ